MNRIVYVTNGSTVIVTPVISLDDPEGFTEKNALDRAMSKDVPKDATDVRIVSEEEAAEIRASR